jgi:uncharacterized protein (TIGR02646 family)
VIRVERPPEAVAAVYVDGGVERANALAHFVPTVVKGFTFSAYKALIVKETLGRAFNFKCAYCESFFDATQPVAVEHFRPKSGYLVPQEKKPTQPGYYWLAAAWDNLLPSCTDCNSERTQTLPDGTKQVVGKANQFPIASEAKRAKQPDAEKQEGRLLLHPYHDHPEKHLVFLPDGIVTWQRPGKSPSRKGRESIRVYALLRDGLVRRRAERERDLRVQMAIAEDLVAALQESPGNAALNQAFSRQLDLLELFTKPDRQYSEMATQLLLPFLARLRNLT